MSLKFRPGEPGHIGGAKNHLPLFFNSCARNERAIVSFSKGFLSLGSFLRNKEKRRFLHNETANDYKFVT